MPPVVVVVVVVVVVYFTSIYIHTLALNINLNYISRRLIFTKITPARVFK